MKLKRILKLNEKGKATDYIFYIYILSFLYKKNIKNIKSFKSL